MTTSSSGAFEYDDAGRQTRRTITDEVTGKVTTEVLTWDVASNLVSSVVDDGSHYDYWTYLYDASGQRWAKIEHPTDVTLPTQATVYLGDTEITDTDTFVNDATPDVTATRFFTFGGSTVATEIATEGAATVPFFFLFGDYQGCAQLMMSNLRARRYDPPNRDHPTQRLHPVWVAARAKHGPVRRLPGRHLRPGLEH